MYLPIPVLVALGTVIMMVLKLDWLGSGIAIALILIVSLISAFVRTGVYSGSKKLHSE